MSATSLMNFSLHSGARKSVPSVLAVITARGGSKGLPGKNILPLAGKPLIAWTIHAALDAASISQVIVSTDSAQIAEAALQAGAKVPFMRPAELATDSAKSVDVVIHALQQCPGYDYCVLIQPTSPLLTSSDLDQAFSQIQATNAEGCIAVCEAMESPWLMHSINSSGWMEPLLSPLSGSTRRQDLPKAYILNGAFYFIRCDTLLQERTLRTPRTICHVMPTARSIDIDTRADLDQAETYLTAQSI